MRLRSEVCGLAVRFGGTIWNSLKLTTPKVSGWQVELLLRLIQASLWSTGRLPIMIEVVVTNRNGIMTSQQYLTVTSLAEYNKLIFTLFNEETLGDDLKRIIRETREALAALEHDGTPATAEPSAETGVSGVGQGVDAGVRGTEQDGTSVQGVSQE